jgi:hypothetical protein
MSRRTLAKTCAAVLLTVLASISNGHAWGTAGHRVVAELAEQFLEISSARQVRDLLALENVTTLAHVSVWADQIRLQRPETAPWHFVNIPIDSPSGTPAAFEPSGIARWTIVWSLKSISLLGFSVIQIHRLGTDSKRSNFLCISWQISISRCIALTIMTEVETTPGSSSTEDPPPCTPCGIAASLPRPWMLTSAATLLHLRAPLQRRRPRFGVAAHWIGQTRVIGLRRA